MKPWVKLYREERGSFAVLPLMARGLFAELLKLADEDGVIDCGGMKPEAYIFRVLGADKSDRRMVRKYLPMLLADGCIEEADRGFVFPGWERHQATGSRPVRRRIDNEPATNGQRTGQKSPVRGPFDAESTSKRPRTGHETQAKPPESHDSPRQIRVEKSREDKTENARANGDIFSLVSESFSRLRQAHGGGPFRAGPTVYREVDDIAEFVRDESVRNGLDPQEVIDKILSHWSTDPWVVANNFPLRQLAKDPGRWLTPPKKTPEKPTSSGRRVLDDERQALPDLAALRREHPEAFA